MSKLAILGYVVVLCLVGIAFGGINSGYQYMDPMVLVYTIVFLLLTLWGTRTMQVFITGIKIALGFKKSYSMLELKKAEETMNLIMKSQLVFGSIVCVMGLIDMLYHMDNLVTLGPALAVAFISIFYALFISLILTPFKARMRLLLISYAEENSTTEEEVNEELLEQRVFYLFRSKGLTDREAEIARLISQELTNREIAGKLYISEATVKKHITHILEKLQLEGREAIIELINNENAPRNTFTVSSETHE